MGAPRPEPPDPPERTGEAFKDYRSHVEAGHGRVGKSTLFRSPNLLLGLNHLEAGAEQSLHTHGGQDKFYFVLEGQGEFTVGDEVREVGAGHVVWARADALHGVRNPGPARLILLVGIAPAP